VVQETKDPPSMNFPGSTFITTDSSSLLNSTLNGSIFSAKLLLGISSSNLEKFLFYILKNFIETRTMSIDSFYQCFKSRFKDIFSFASRPSCEKFAVKVSQSFEYCYFRYVYASDRPVEEEIIEKIFDEVFNYIKDTLERYMLCDGSDIEFARYLCMWSLWFPASKELCRYFRRKTNIIKGLNLKFSLSATFSKNKPFVKQVMEVPIYSHKRSSKRFSEILSEILNNNVDSDFTKEIFDDNYFLYEHQALAFDELKRPGPRVVVVATPNASGKTEIGILTAMSIVKEGGNKLILAIYPTKALARDQFDRWKNRLRKFCEKALKCDIKDEEKFYLISDKLDIILLDGDTIKKLRDKLKIITSGYEPLVVLSNSQFFLTILQNNSWRKYFGRRCLHFLLLDEIHFYRSRDLTLLIKILEPSIIGSYICKSAVNDEYKVLMLSATMGDPDRFKDQIINAWHFKDVAIITSELGDKVGVKNIYVIKVDDDRIAEGIIEEFVKELFSKAIDPEDIDKTLIFVPNRNIADRLQRRLQNIAYRKFKTLGIVERHLGDMALWERENIERKFKEGETRILITVKTLEIGIDIGDVMRVVHWGLPPSLNDIIQREGRTGRRPGEYESLIIIRTAYDENLTEKYLKLLNDISEKRSLQNILKYTHTPTINLNASVMRWLDYNIKHSARTPPIKTLFDYLDKNRGHLRNEV